MGTSIVSFDHFSELQECLFQTLGRFCLVLRNQAFDAERTTDTIRFSQGVLSILYLESSLQNLFPIRYIFLIQKTMPIGEGFDSYCDTYCRDKENLNLSVKSKKRLPQAGMFLPYFKRRNWILSSSRKYFCKSLAGKGLPCAG